MKIKLSESIFDSKLFAGLTGAEMSDFVDKAKPRKYAAGSPIVNEGEVGNEFYWMAAGCVQIQTRIGKDKTVMTLNTLEKGDVLGEMVLLGFAKRSGTAIAVEDTEVFVWNYQECVELFKVQPNIGYRILLNLGQMIGQRLINMNAKLKERVEGTESSWLSL